MGFQEFILSNGHTEIQVDIDVDTGKVIDLYSSDEVEYYSEKKEDFLKLSWEKGRNPLFSHCPKNQIKRDIKRILGEYTEFVFCFDTQEELEVLWKFENFYELNLDLAR